MSDSKKWLDNYQDEQRRLKIQEDRNKITKEKIHHDSMNAQADREMRYQLTIQQEEERTKRERMKLEQEKTELQQHTLADLYKAKVLAQNNIDLEEMRFQQGMQNKYADYRYLQALKELENNHNIQNQALENNYKTQNQARDHEQERYLQANKFAYELKNKEIDNEQARILQTNDIDYKLKSQTLDHKQARILQTNEIDYKLKSQALDHEQAKALQVLKASYELALKEEERKTYAHNVAVDTQNHIARIASETKEYQKKVKIDEMAQWEKTAMEKDKRINEAFCYDYERAVDAKWKVWVMQQEQKLLGHKVTDEEINEHIKRNRAKWDDEIE